MTSICVYGNVLKDDCCGSHQNEAQSVILQGLSHRAMTQSLPFYETMHQAISFADNASQQQSLSMVGQNIRLLGGERRGQGVSGNNNFF